MNKIKQLKFEQSQSYPDTLTAKVSFGKYTISSYNTIVGYFNIPEFTHGDYWRTLSEDRTITLDEAKSICQKHFETIVSDCLY